MSDAALRELIKLASNVAEKIFRKDGEFRPLWHAILPNGESAFLKATLEDKDLDIAMVRAFFELKHVVRYVFIAEAWTLDRSRGKPLDEDELAQIRNEGVSNHPDRVEVVFFSGEDEAARTITAQRKIIRERGRKAWLGPLIFDEPMPLTEGRMVGLLPRKGMMQ